MRTSSCAVQVPRRQCGWRCAAHKCVHTHAHRDACPAVSWQTAFSPLPGVEHWGTVPCVLQSKCHLPPSAFHSSIQGPWSHTLPESEIHWLRERAKGSGKSWGRALTWAQTPMWPWAGPFPSQPSAFAQIPRNPPGRKKMNPLIFGAPMQALCVIGCLQAPMAPTGSRASAGTQSNNPAEVHT